MSQNHIHLINSTSSLNKMFRVVAEGYDDGTYHKAEDIKFALGGGLDRSLGAVYRTWSMIIKVRQEETESGYGDREDLETFYKYNNPGGSPSPTITFADHHHTDNGGPTPTISVKMIGDMPPSALGCMIEGTDAWFLFRVQLIEDV
jgi:hypothetical protein